jgi:phosphoserine phosphatase RsbX
VPDADCYLIRRPLTGRDDECGDTGVIKESEGERFLALVDALGHGRAAHDVAVLAEHYLQQNYRQDLVALLEGLHASLRGTAGAVAACCRLTLATGQLRYAGMGNITVRLLGPRASRFVLRDGILGYTISSPREKTVMLSPGDVLVMYSDGIEEHFDARECGPFLVGSAETIAANVMRRFDKEADDASCLVLRYTR